MVNYRKIYSQRFIEIDGLKGLAIFAIVILHFINHFNTENYTGFADPLISKTDVLVNKLSASLLFGKFYLIFSLLFGFTFFIQTEGQRIKGIYSNRKIMARIAMLLIFGIINCAFFPHGDILTLYALMAIVIMPLNYLKTPVLIVIATILILQPIQLYEIYKLSTDANYILPLNKSDVLSAEIANVMKHGNFWEILYINITKGQLASLLWAFESGRLTQVLSLFLYGIVAGRLGIFNIKNYNKSFWTGALFFLVAFFLIIYWQKHIVVSGGLSADLNTVVALTFSLWLNILFSFIVIAAFIILYNSGIKRWLHPFTYLGRMSLTNYMFQSMIGAFLFFPFGLNLANKLGSTYSFLLSIVIGFILIYFSKEWLKAFKHGPMESLWKRLYQFSVH